MGFDTTFDADFECQPRRRLVDEMDLWDESIHENHNPHAQNEPDEWSAEPCLHSRNDVNATQWQETYQPPWDNERRVDVSSPGFLKNIASSRDFSSNDRSSVLTYQNKEAPNVACNEPQSFEHFRDSVADAASSSNPTYVHPSTTYDRHGWIGPATDQSQRDFSNLEDSTAQDRSEMMPDSYATTSQTAQSSQSLVGTKPAQVMAGTIHLSIDGKCRSFRCTDLTCDVKSFTRMADLERHYLQKHALQKPEYWCPVLRCPRLEPFARKDKMQDHAQTKHV